MFYVYGLYIKGDDWPFYIGKTHILSRRFQEHMSDAFAPSRKRDTIKANTIRKAVELGKEIEERCIRRFKHEECALAYERSLIHRLGRRNTGTGILANLTDGGEAGTGIIHSPETRAKMSKSKLGNKINLGRKRPDTTVRLSKPVTVFDQYGANIGNYDSQRLAAEAINIDYKFINACLRPNRPYKSTKSKDGTIYQFRYGKLEGNIDAVSYREHRSSTQV